MALLELMQDAIQTAPRGQQAVQQRWARTPLALRLKLLGRTRHLLARRTGELTDALAGVGARTRADSLAAEVLPLLAACRYLEREARAILATRRLGVEGRPLWLAGVSSLVERVPLGTILVIGPSNYPLFLPGTQVLQALAAGNAAVWKPGLGGEPAARVVEQALREAGLPAGLLRVTQDSIAAAEAELAQTQDNQAPYHQAPDKIVFTGSAAAGRTVLAAAARMAVPVVAELSSCDAVLVLPSANVEQVVEALAFGMRLNGSATCMAPRRLILAGEPPAGLLPALLGCFDAMPPVTLAAPVAERLGTLLAEAESMGASVQGRRTGTSVTPTLVLGGQPAMEIARADIFAPVLTVLEAADAEAAVALAEGSPYGLTTAIFGAEAEARRLAARLTVGTVLVNDIIVPTADPRVPFGGRKASGYGATRGAEGLLEMTAPRVLSVRRGRARRHYEPTGEAHAAMFTALALATHAATWRERIEGLRQLTLALRRLGTGKQAGEKNL